MPGADAPAAKICAVVRHGHTGNTRHSPRNGFYSLLRALPGDQELFVTVASGIASTNLTPTLRRQDHTTWPSDLASPVSRAATSHRIPPRVRDVRETPL